MIRIKVGDGVYPVQLSTGALPNVISRTTADVWIKNHGDKIRNIQLSQPLELKLTSDKKSINAEDTMVQVIMTFGDVDIEIPFYVIGSRDQICVIGQLSMGMLGIQPMVKYKVAQVQLERRDYYLEYRYLEPDEFQNLVVCEFDVEKDCEYEMVQRLMKNTNIVDVQFAENDQSTPSTSEASSFIETNKYSSDANDYVSISVMKGKRG